MNRFRKYMAALSMGVANSMEYRADFFMRLISTVFPIIIQIFLWLAIYGGSESKVLYGFTLPQIILYAFMAGAVGQFVNTGIESVINSDIHAGGLARFLTQPVAYVPFRLMGVFGQKALNGAVMLLLAGVLALVFGAGLGLRLDAGMLLLFAPALILAVVLNFFLFFLISLTAFWLTEVGSFFHAINVVVMVVSGGVFPVEVLGGAFVSVMRWLPFLYTINFPVRVLSGSLDMGQALYGLMIQAGWIAALAALSHGLWKTGLRKYVAVGG